jgi:hypothetical protein
VLWRYTSAIPALGRLRQKGWEFGASLGYIARPFLRMMKEGERER